MLRFQINEINKLRESERDREEEEEKKSQGNKMDL